MAKFDSEEELDDIIEKIKSDLQTIDATIELLIKEAKARSAPQLKYHDVTNPLTKLIATKQKYLDQLIKIYKEDKQYTDEEVQLNLDGLYSKFEKEVEA